MNFNLKKTVDYQLQHSLVDELINMYGVQVKLIIAEKVNMDATVFGDFSHLKSDSKKIYEVYGMPETSAEWDNININFSQFGMLNMETINLFFSRKTIDGIFGDFDAGRGFEDILGNLIVLPNNRIIEITDIEFQVPGISNLYTELDQKNVYKFTCKTYDMKLVNEVPQADLGGVDEPGDYSVLDDYFDELTVEEEAVDTEAEVIPNTITNKPVIETDEDPVFGKLG